MVSYKNPQEFTVKWQKYQEYIGALEEERKKIQVFERELPLCLELVTQAIERYRQQGSGMIEDCFNGRQVSSDYPVLEEYIPMKRTSSANEEDGDTQKQQKQQLFHKSKIVCSKDWLASAQLSIQTPDPPIEVDLLSKKLLDMEGDRNGCRGFHPFQKKNTSDAALTIGVERCAAVVSTAAISSSVDTDFGGSDGGGGGSDGGGISRVEDKGRVNKKERRCWSPELHRRFLHALQQLGGAHAATPKQIKESMKVDGLTNDEIKSHLQKYRLHTRRMNPSLHNDAQTPQLMLVGRIWMPPLEHTTKTASSLPTATANNANTLYTPIASLPLSITTSLYKTKPCKQRPPSVEKN